MQAKSSNINKQGGGNYAHPTVDNKKLWIRVRQFPDPNSPAYNDASIYGVSNLSNIPFGNIPYTNINSIERSYKFPLKIEEKADIEVRALSPTNNMKCASTFCILLVQNNDT